MTITPQGFVQNAPSASSSGVASSVREKFLANKDYQRAINDYRATIVSEGIVVQAQLPQEFVFDVASQYEDTFAQGINGMMGQAGTIANAFGLRFTTQAFTAQQWQGSSQIDFSIPLIFQAEKDEIDEVMKPIMQLMYLVTAKEESQGGMLSAPGPHFDYRKLKDSAKAGASTITDKQTQTVTSDLLTSAKNLGSSVNTVVQSLMNGTFTADNINNTGYSGNNAFQASRNAVDNMGRVISSTLVNSIANNISLYIGRYMYFPSVVITSVQQTHAVQPLKGSGNYQRVEVNVGFKTFMLPTQRDIPTMFPNSGAAGQEIRQLASGEAGTNGSANAPTEWVSQG